MGNCNSKSKIKDCISIDQIFDIDELYEDLDKLYELPLIEQHRYKKRNIYKYSIYQIYHDELKRRG